ncbi:hypothetical protein JW992_01245 [candidate division KSB1 bacterium]|nr:hypothetical protein [candidate division KSB1 bacterium]
METTGGEFIKKNCLWLMMLIIINSNVFAATLIQDKYRWRNDDGSETSATWKAGENAPISYGGTENIRVRFQFYIPEQASMDAWQIALYYATSTDGPWTQMSTDGSTNHFILSLSDNFADQDPTARQLSENTEHTFEAGKIIESTELSPFGLGTSKSTEYEICFKATVNAENKIYYFKPNLYVEGEGPATNIFTHYEYAVMAYNIIFVDSDASGSDDGSSWANACTSLQSALDVAASGCQIWVAAGTCKPSKEPEGTTDEHRKFAFQMKNDVEIYGGFAGTETDLSQRNFIANETILSGDLAGNDDFDITNWGYQETTGDDNCYSVFFHFGIGLTSSAVLDGFTISGGNANASFPGNGGAGMVNHSSSPTIRNITFKHNASVDGGTLFLLFSGGADLSNLTFIENHGGDGSGGLYLYEMTSATTLTNALFVHNRGGYGGGVKNYNSTTTVTNATFYGNRAINDGGAVSNSMNGTLTLNNCIIWNNSANGEGDEIYHGGNTTTLHNCCYQNEAGDVYGTLTSANCITSDPKFIDSDHNDFTLYGISPCVNTEDNAYNAEPYGLRGKARIQNMTIDMGAYEWNSGTDPEKRILNVNDDASGSNDGSSWSNAYTSLQSALDVAISDDEIWIAAGTYYPSSAYDLTNEPRYYHFRLIEGVEVYGGFAGTENSIDERTNFGYGKGNETILSGDIGTEGDNSDNCYHVIYNPNGTGITNAAMLDRVTITAGNANNTAVTELKRGGWLYMPYNSPTIKNVVIAGNYGYFGGGAFNMASSAVYENCLFFNNRSGYGGDGDGNNVIETTDYTAWKSAAQLGNSGYQITDLNLDGQVTTADYVRWYNSKKAGVSCQVP